ETDEGGERRRHEPDLEQRPHRLRVAGGDELSPHPPQERDDRERPGRLLDVQALREVRHGGAGGEGDRELPGTALAAREPAREPEEREREGERQDTRRRG